MKKTIVAAAIAAVVAAPAVMADVTIYGKAHIDITDGDDSNGTAAGTPTESITSNASRWGLKGSEDLGNGMKASFLTEFGSDNIDGTATPGSRDSWVGISGDFGSVKVGRMGGPNKGVLYGTGNVQVADSVADFADGFDAKSSSSNFGRVSNAIAYSNSFNGVDVTLATVGNDSNDNFANTAFSLGTTIGGAKVAVAHTDIDGTKTGTIFGAKMSMDALTAGVVYEEVDFDAAATADYDTLGVSLSYKMGNNTFAVSTSTRDTDGATADIDKTNISLQHSLSKRTSVYIAQGDSDNGTSTKNTAVGIIHSF